MPARILIIEDNPANLDLMTYLLKTLGHAALTAKEGEEGMAAARREKPDLILCDIQLPGLDGYAVARAISADPGLCAIPLVAVTAFAMVGDRDKVLARGFDGYIAKPIEPETFVDEVEGFLQPNLRSSGAARAASTEPIVPAVSKHVTILVVDDEEVNLSLNHSILEPLGYTVVSAHEIAQGLKLARQAPPDLIVSDLGMSDGTGFDFIQEVKADPRLKEIPFVFVTSTHYDQASRAKGLALGAARFLFRPLEPQVLLGEIEACLTERKRR